MKTKNNRFYTVMYFLFSRIVKLVFRVHVYGAENEPANGGYIACSNHLSDSDVVIIGAVLKNQVRFLAKAELFRIPFVKQLVTAFGAYPIKRGQSDVGAIKNTIDLLESGEVVGVYPQGTRCPGVDPRETKYKSGVGLITYRSKAAVLPICIQTKDFRIRPFRRTNVTIGKPLTYDEFDFKTGARDEYERAAKMVFDRILSMVK